MHRFARWLVGITVAAVISLSAGAAVGLGQYGEEPPGATTTNPTTGVSGVSGTDTRQTKLLKCIAKAQTKFGDNKPKRKQAIRRCKKKFGKKK